MHSTVTTLPRHQMLIDGELVASQKTIAVVNPTTEEVISEVPSGTLEDVNAAVLAAEKAQKSWSQLPAIERAHYLREIAQGIRADREHLAHVITEEQGKILSLAQVEVDFSADYLDYMQSLRAAMRGRSSRAIAVEKISCCSSIRLA